MQNKPAPATISNRLTILWSPFKLTTLRLAMVAWARFSCMASSDRKALRLEVPAFDSQLSGDGQPRQTPSAHGPGECIALRLARRPRERRIPAPASAAVRSIPVGAVQ